MIRKTSTLRIARPTDKLAEITKMYVDGLGFERLGGFEDHNGFDGAIIGHIDHSFHFEFTHHRGTEVGKAPTQDNLLVFYVPDRSEWELSCKRMLQAHFLKVASYNPYWDVAGKTFEDLDGYRVVFQSAVWPPE